MKKVLSVILNNFRYPSTWNGLIAIITAFGVALSPEQTEAIVVAGLGLVGVISVFVSDVDIEDKK